MLDGAIPPVTWKYYTNDKKNLWTAPNAIEGICEPLTLGALDCNPVGTDWLNVINESEANEHPAQILDDILGCASGTVPNVSFVVPDGAWSDHAGVKIQTSALGPSWVAAIVNAVGNNSSTCPVNWANTVILVTWDDWGGWYDHVDPDPNGITGYSDGSGNAYVYGFRVPLLVVSAYSAVPAPPNTGYVSGYASFTGDANAPTSCPTVPDTRYCHDFGSILNFIEYVFGQNGNTLGEISPNYHYADFFAPDAPHNCITCPYPYALGDFFLFNQSPRPFTTIPAPHLASYFQTWEGAAQDPDDDASE